MTNLSIFSAAPIRPLAHCLKQNCRALAYNEANPISAYRFLAPPLTLSAGMPDRHQILFKDRTEIDGRAQDAFWAAPSTTYWLRGLEPAEVMGVGVGKLFKVTYSLYSDDCACFDRGMRLGADRSDTGTQ
jgi:hypothetical protein